MTQNHDSDARLAMLKDTIDRNRDKLADHDFEGEKDLKESKSRTK